MICFMHEGTPYGHLKVGSKVILPANLAGMVGATLDDVEGWLAELELAGVFSRDESGCILSKRMIRDERIRESRASGGKLGGNPALIDPERLGERLTLKVKQNPTPSSSTSSSKFSKPSVADVAEYVKTLVPPVLDAGKFVDFYEAKGWKVGKSPMKDWQAAVRNWHRTERKNVAPQFPSFGTSSVRGLHDY